MIAIVIFLLRRDTFFGKKVAKKTEKIFLLADSLVNNEVCHVLADSLLEVYQFIHLRNKFKKKYLNK